MDGVELLDCVYWFLKVYNIAMKGNVHANKPKISMLNIILSDALETMPRNSMYSPALWLYIYISDGVY